VEEAKLFATPRRAVGFDPGVPTASEAASSLRVFLVAKVGITQLKNNADIFSLGLKNSVAVAVTDDL